MKHYELNHFYDFQVTGVGYGYINLKDDEGGIFCVKAFDFQLEWDWSSKQVPAEAIPCYVKEINEENGRIYLHQSRYHVLCSLYKQAKQGIREEGVFVLEYRKTINGEVYYVVRDVYGLTHLYKPTSDEPDMHAGDELLLYATEIVERAENKAYLLLTSEASTVQGASQVEDMEKEKSDTPKPGYYGEEGNKKEFKSTIVYPAGATGPDIDKQIEIIVKTLAGFMNADGGTLFIGVNDNGEPIGIENEYKLLNTSEREKNKTYPERKDGYQSKIRSAVEYYLSPVAGSYVTISFEEREGHTICRVDVERSTTVIWFRELYAYKRLGNRTSRLRSEAIVKLCFDKYGQSRPNLVTLPPSITDGENDNLGEDGDTGTKPEKTKNTNVIAKRTGADSFYMNIFENGKWSWSKDVPQDPSLEFCVPINSPIRRWNLIMVYENGCVDRVSPMYMHYRNNNEGYPYEKAKRNDGVKLVKVFTALDDDLIACFSTQDGHPFVKVHKVSDFSVHQQMGNKGNLAIKYVGNNVVVDDICFVSNEQFYRISALLKTTQPSNSPGFQMDLPRNAKYQFAVETLRQLCNNEVIDITTK